MSLPNSLCTKKIASNVLDLFLAPIKEISRFLFFAKEGA